MPKARAINKIAAFVADNQEPAGGRTVSDCAARAVSCVINGAVEVATGYPAIPHSPGVITHSRHQVPGVGAFYQRVPVFTVAEIDHAFFSRTQSSLAEHRSAVFSICRQNHQAIPCRIFELLNVMGADARFIFRFRVQLAINCFGNAVALLTNSDSGNGNERASSR